MRYITILFLLLTSSLNGFDYCDLTRVLFSQAPPFSYDLKIKVNPGPCRNAPVLIAFHGSGGNNSIGDTLASYPVITDHIISFNLPDADKQIGQQSAHCMTHGSIQELLPAIYMIKKVVVEGGADAVNLYGFSAGGGVLVNVLGVLNSKENDHYLESVGIKCSHKKQMLEAIQNGHIILEVPLKSIEEVIAHRGSNYDLFVLGQRYRQWDLRPINSLEKLDGLNLDILVYFEDGDEALSNRDDELYLQRVRRNNNLGNTVTVIGKSGGHMGYHAALWQMYPQFIRGRVQNTLVKKVDIAPCVTPEPQSQLCRMEHEEPNRCCGWCPTDSVACMDEWYEYPNEENGYQPNQPPPGYPCEQQTCNHQEQCYMYKQQPQQQTQCCPYHQQQQQQQQQQHYQYPYQYYYPSQY